MSMLANRKDLRVALCTGPTQHWGSTLRRAEHIIMQGTVCCFNERMVVEDKAWNDAMQELRSLPCGGRHVWKARAQLWRDIERATNLGETQ